VAEDPRPLSDSLDALLRALRGGERRTTATVFGRWTELVGEQIAAHARPVKLDGGRLLVEVDEPGWATQLRFLEAELVARLRGEGQLAVDTLEVRVRRSPGSRGDVTPPW
jgi:predicted nucleic acid-binding Zn ribbon protein